MGWAAMKPRIAARMGPSLEGLCCKFQMQTSLSPSVCRAFLGCQIEKAVDELNLTKKIISCHPSTFAPSGPCGLQCCSSTAHTDVLQGGEEVGALFWDVLQLSGVVAGDVEK